MSILYVICLHSEDVDITKLFLCVCKDIKNTIWKDKLTYEGIEPCNFWTPKMTYMYHKKDLRVLATYYRSGDPFGFIIIDPKLRLYTKETKEIIKYIHHDICINSLLLNPISYTQRFCLVVIDPNDTYNYEYYYFDDRDKAEEQIEIWQNDNMSYGIIDMKKLVLEYPDSVKGVDDVKNIEDVDDPGMAINYFPYIERY